MGMEIGLTFGLLGAAAGVGITIMKSHLRVDRPLAR